MGVREDGVREVLVAFAFGLLLDIGTMDTPKENSRSIQQDILLLNIYI